MMTQLFFFFFQNFFQQRVQKRVNKDLKIRAVKRKMFAEVW